MFRVASSTRGLCGTVSAKPPRYVVNMGLNEAVQLYYLELAKPEQARIVPTSLTQVFLLAGRLLVGVAALLASEGA